MKIVSKEFAQKITSQVKKNIEPYSFNIYSTKIQSYSKAKEVWMEIRMTSGDYTPIPHKLMKIVQKYGIIMALDPVENDSKTTIKINGIEYVKTNAVQNNGILDIKWYDLFITFPLELEINTEELETHWKKLHDMYVNDLGEID